MKRTEPLSVKQIIDRVVQEGNLTEKVAEQRVCYLWPEIVGAGINRYTLRRYVADGVLHVYLTSGPLKNELQFHRQHLISSINEAVGQEAIRDIVFH